MKKLLYICLALWLFLYFGKALYPTVMGHWAIEWPVIALLAILLPIGFAKSLVVYFGYENKGWKSLATPSSFLAIFLLLLIGPLVVSLGLTSLTAYPLSYTTNTGAILAQGLIYGQKEESRLFVARIIFEESGKKVPYRLDSGEYKTFEPTAEDEAKYIEYKATKDKTKKLMKQASDMSQQAMLTSFALVISFLLIFIVTLKLEQKKLTE